MGRDCTSKLYVGRLPDGTTEEALKAFFLKGNTVPNLFTVSIKKNYCFVQCNDQATADQIIDNFHGKTFNGSAICVEPAVNAGCPLMKHAKVLVTLVSTDNNQKSGQAPGVEDIDQILSTWNGSLLSMEKQSHNSFIVTVGSVKLAMDFIIHCNDKAHNGYRIKADIATDPILVVRSGSRGSGSDEFKPKKGFDEVEDGNSSATVQHYASRGRSLNPRSNMDSTQIQRNGGCYVNVNYGTYGITSHFQQTCGNLPWRMLIPSDQVGALIGRQGATIRAITDETGVRINIHTGMNPRYPEIDRVVSMHGKPDNISKACRKVMEILAKDLSQTGTRGLELCLRLLAFNSLIGRVIGRNGANITSIMNETQTKIHISSVQEMSRILPKHVDSDRIISIRGSLVGMSVAESLVSAKLRSCFSQGVQQKYADGGGHGSAPISVGAGHYQQ